MFASAKGEQKKNFRQLQCQKQCINHIPYYLSGLSRAHFCRQPFLKWLYVIGDSGPLRQAANVAKIQSERG